MPTAPRTRPRIQRKAAIAWRRLSRMFAARPANKGERALAGTVFTGPHAPADQALPITAAELCATLENMFQGVVLMRSGRIIFNNARALELAETASTLELADKLTAAAAAHAASDARRERRALSPHRWRSDFETPAGRIVEVRADTSSAFGQVYTLNDVSALKKRQAEMEKAIDSARAADEAKTRFFSTMSHEMRTPLNGVIGTLELLRGTRLDAEQQELVSVAMQSSDALLVHINDVLDFSKMEAGKLDLNPEPFSLKEVVKSVIEVVAPQARHRKNQVVKDIDAAIPEYLLGDRIRIGQILLNFASNAMKFTTEGRVTIRVKRLGGTDAQPELEFAVADTGAGIPQDRLGKLFREFAMVHAVSKETNGTGLGLAICKRIVEAMSGTVGVESKEGYGSTFYFRVVLPAADVAPKNTQQPSGHHSAKDRSLNVLLVDDNATNRLVGNKLLTSAGHTVTMAHNGREAVDAAEKIIFDAIFMDISMPVMDGLEATAHIRAMPQPYCSVPIIALTANAISGDRERFLAAGMDDYLTKPLRRAEIESRLIELSARKSGADQAKVPAAGAVAA